MNQVAANPSTRPRRSDITRRHILETALALFRERGFDATTMRDVAAAAGVAVGGAYYYFKSKEDMILDFYERTQSESSNALRDIKACHTDAFSRLRAVYLQKIDQMTPHRELARILVRHALDTQSPLSPFSGATATIRNQSIAIIAGALESTSIRVADELRPLLPTVFWMLQMVILLFWIFDTSHGQTRTRKLIDDALGLAFLMLRFSRLPLTGRFWRPVLELLSEFEILPQGDTA